MENAMGGLYLHEFKVGLCWIHKHRLQTAVPALDILCAALCYYSNLQSFSPFLHLSPKVPAWEKKELLVILGTDANCGFLSLPVFLVRQSFVPVCKPRLQPGPLQVSRCAPVNQLLYSVYRNVSALKKQMLVGRTYCLGDWCNLCCFCFYIFLFRPVDQVFWSSVSYEPNAAVNYYSKRWKLPIHPERDLRMMANTNSLLKTRLYCYWCGINNELKRCVWGCSESKTSI